METLTKLYREKNWRAFAVEFRSEYYKADEEGKLRLLRALLNRFRHTKVLHCVLVLMPHLRVVQLMAIVTK